MRMKLPTSENTTNAIVTNGNVPTCESITSPMTVNTNTLTAISGPRPSVSLMPDSNAFFGTNFFGKFFNEKPSFNACETTNKLLARPMRKQTGSAIVRYSAGVWCRQRGWNTVKAPNNTAAANNGQKFGRAVVSAGYSATVDSNAVQAHIITTARRGP